MSDGKSIFQKTAEMLNKKDEVDEEIEEDYGEDFEKDDEASESKSKDSPAKKPSPVKKDASIIESTDKGITLTKTTEESKHSDQPEKPKLPQLDAETLERIDLEEAIIELKGIAKTKRDAFLTFCEEKENERLKIGKDIQKSTTTSSNPFSRLKKENAKKEVADEASKIQRKGRLTLEEFMEVLKFFEFKHNKKEMIEKLLKALTCFYAGTNSVYYLKVLRQLCRRASHYNKVTKVFDYYKPIKTFVDQNSAVDYIRNHMRTYKKKVMEQKEKEKEELQKTYEVEVPIEEIISDPEKFLNLLKEKVAASTRSLRDIFKGFDDNGDGVISFEEFKKSMLATKIRFSDDLISAVFKRFDQDDTGTISYMKFLATIYADDNSKDLFDYMKGAEDNYFKIKKILQANFTSWEECRRKMNTSDSDKMTEVEFKQFVLSQTDFFSKLQLSDVFMFLDSDRKKYLDILQMKRLYMAEFEDKIQESKPKEPEPPKEDPRDVLTKPTVVKTASQLPPEEKFSETEQKLLANAFKPDSTKNATIDPKGDPSKVKSALKSPQGLKEISFIKKDKSVSILEKPEPPSRGDNVSVHSADSKLSQLEQWRKFMTEMSNLAMKESERAGKTLKDYFNIFSKISIGSLTEEEFINLCKALMSSDFNLHAAKSFFNFYVTGFPKRMSYKTFSQIVLVGKKGNPLYLKLVEKLGPGYDRVRKGFAAEFQRMDATEGTGSIPLSDIRSILAINEIKLGDAEIRYLSEEGCLSIENGKQYIKYEKFLKVAMPPENPLDKEIFQQSARRIIRFLRILILRKKNMRKRGNMSHLLELRKPSVSSSKSKKDTKKTGKKVQIETPSKEQPRLKVSEVFEFEGRNESAVSPDKSQEIDKKKSPGRSASPKKKGKADKSLTLEEKIKKALPEPQIDEKAKEKAQKVYNKFRNLILDLVDKAVGYGESLKLAREIQHKYESRPVLKDVFIALQDLELEVVDPLPRSLCISSTTGRLVYLDKEGNMEQYDMANRQELRKLNLGSKMPLKRSKLIDFVFDNKAGRIYTLTDSWMLEVWEIHQELSIPVSRLKIISESFDPETINMSYHQRYGDVFPEFITLSTNTHQLLIVNCSCVNNSIVFVDPVSLSIFSQIYLKQDDYKIPNSLNRILTSLKPQLDEMVKHGETFEKAFADVLSKREGNLVISKFDFIPSFRRNFSIPSIKDGELGDMFVFLDQDADGFISIQDLAFLSEMAKMQTMRKKEEKISVPVSLQSLEPGPMKALQKLIEFVKKTRLNLLEAFKIFDGNNSGSISASEFFAVLDQLVPGINFEDKQNLLKAADKDKSNTIELNEFVALFDDIETFNTFNAQRHNINLRTSLQVIIEKSFENGIDFEELFLKYDTEANGAIQVIDFKTILRNLPFGITEEEGEYILKNEVTYTDNGRVDYQKVVQDPEFAKSKVVAKLKTSQATNVKEVLNKLDDDEHKFEPQKILVESLIYVDDYDLMIYTTILPRTSTIFVSSAKNKMSKENSNDSRSLFSNKLLARLEGHKSGLPPTIKFIDESGCLISADKIEKKTTHSNPRATGDMSSTGAVRESFINFYQNIEVSKQYSADIIIWNFEKSLFELCDTQPPWRVLPSHIIKGAHYDSVLDIQYLPISQLIATSSADHTIKLWDPVARPFPLNHPKNTTIVRRKPGVYEPAEEQFTESNQKFGEIRTIYTGDQVCYKLHVAVFKAPAINLSPDQNIAGRVVQFETLATLCLGKPQISGKTLKRKGYLRGYAIDRLQIEIPAKKVDDIIPKTYLKELEDLCIERRKKALLFLQRSLPSSLETQKVKVLIQNTNLKKIMDSFKRISLMKFMTDKNINLDEEVMNLFKLFTQLPLRVSFESFINDAGLKNQLSISELYYYLKRFRQLHPLSITKGEFYKMIGDIDSRVKKNILSESKKLNLLMENISKEIKTGNINFKADLFENKKSGVTTRDKLVNYFAVKNVYTTEKEAEQLLNIVDPYITNSINLSSIEEMFGKDILEFKLSVYNKPIQLIRSLVGGLDSKQKMLLLLSLNDCNLAKDNYLTREEFIQGFINTGFEFNKLEIIELYELLSEKYSQSDDAKHINLSYFAKKLFSQNENIELIRIYHIIGKVKNGFTYKRLIPQQIFADINPETKAYSKSSAQNISTQDFIKRIDELRIPNLHIKEIERLANFLSLKTPEMPTPFVSLTLFLSYLMKIEIKYQFATVNHFTKLSDSVAEILIKEQELRNMQAKMSKKKLDAPALRHLLNEIKIDFDQVDDIIVRFLDEHETSLEQFLTKLKNFVQSLKEIEVFKPKTEEKSSEADKEFDKLVNDFKGETTEDKFTLTSLLKEKTKDEKGKKIESHQVIDVLSSAIEITKTLRAEGSSKIDKLKQICESFDFDKSGRLNLANFCNILIFNVEGIKEELLVAFQEEWEKGRKEKSIDYHAFFDDYLNDKKADSRRVLELDMNNIMVRVASAINTSKVNVSHAFQFFDEGMTNAITREDFKKVFAWIKADIVEEEYAFLLENLKTQGFKIDYQKFLSLIDVCNFNIAAVYNRDTWNLAADFVHMDLLEKAVSNKDYLESWIKQKLKEFKVSTPKPLMPALVLHKSLGQLKHDFSLQQIDELVMYAIIGSKPTRQEAQRKLNEKDLIDVNTEIVNYEHFIHSLEDVLTKRKENERARLKGTQDTKTPTHRSDETDDQVLINKIKSILQDRSITVWDSIISAHMNITDQSLITLAEFKLIINSLNLGLNLQEKLRLFRIADPSNSGKVDLKRLVDKLEDNTQNERVFKIIFEKLDAALFFNDMSKKALFEFIDEDKDDLVFDIELKNGLSSIDLGLSIFEINQVVNQFKFNAKRQISKADFIKHLESLCKKYEIDASKDLSFSLYAKIKTIIAIKGIDIFECFKSVDLSKKGYVNYDGLLKALEVFGLDNLRPYQVTALLKFNVPPSTSALTSPKGDSQRDSGKRGTDDKKDDKLKNDSKLATFISPRNPEYKVDYALFCKQLLAEVDTNSKLVIEVTHDLLRKIYKMVQTKGISLFESFVHFDINSNNAISRLEFKLGLQNFGIDLTDKDISMVWNSFERMKNFKVNYMSYLKSFVSAGAVPVIKFDEAIDLLVKKFTAIMQKLGNFEEAFSKIDINNQGLVTLNEFKDQCHRLHLGLLPHELETIFTIICGGEKEKMNMEKGMPVVGFNYKQFVKLLLKFKNMGQVDQTFYKIFVTSKERKLIWRQQFLNVKKGNDTKQQSKSAGDLTLRELKNLLKDLKLGVTNEEIDNVIDCFDSGLVNAQAFERRLLDGAAKVDNVNKEKEEQINYLVNEMNLALARDRIPLERLFFEFDEKSSGTIERAQFTKMIQYLKINSTKNQINIFFDSVDHDKKNYISLQELKNFVEDSANQQQLAFEKTNIQNAENKTDALYIKIKEGLGNKGLTIQRAILDQNHRPNEFMTKTSLDKLLNFVGVVLKSDELESLYNSVLASSGTSSCNWEDFQSFAIKNHIEIINFDDKTQFVHPSVTVYVGKMSSIFKKLEINPGIAFNYMCLPTRKVVAKRAFIKGIQGYNMNMTRDDILLLFEYFDEKGYGEITLDTFLEKFEFIVSTSVGRIGDEERAEGEININKLSNRHQIIAILQKIYMLFIEKKYNKRQMIALFDKSGNGIISKDELMEGIKALGLDLQLEKVRALANVLDKTSNGTIEVEDLIQQVFQSVPQNLRGDFKMSQAVAALRSVIERVKEQAKNLLNDLVKFEKTLKHDENNVLRRVKTGIYILDFHRLLREYNVILNEDDKGIIKDAFYIRSHEQDLDIEALYNTIEGIIKSSSEFSDGQTEAELNEMFEQRVYKQIGSKLREMNKSVVQAFDLVDIDKDGLISDKEFRNLFKNISINLSDKELVYLVQRFATFNQGYITRIDFIEKFWNAYAHSGQRMDSESTRIKDLRAHQRKIVTNLLNHFKNKKQWSSERTWALLDHGKKGTIELEDLRKALVEVSYFITKEDTAMVFNFIDSEKDGVIDFIEFSKFWDESTSLFDEGIPVDNELRELEADIIEHLVTVINSKGISLWDFFHDFDRENKGYLTEKEFSFLLKKVGLDLNDVKCEQLLRIIDPQSDKKLTYSKLETRLLQSGLDIRVTKVLEKVTWSDKGLKSIMMALNANLKLENYEEFFKKFDKDFDGILSPEEFFNAIKSLGKGINDEQAQRAANIFQTHLRDNRISIKRASDLLNNVLKSEDEKSEQLEIAAVNFETFKFIVLNYEGINVLFRDLNVARQNFKAMQRFFTESRKKIRGFSLVGSQNSLSHLSKRLKKSVVYLQNAVNLLCKQSATYIVDQATVKYLDPNDNILLLDRDVIKEGEYELSNIDIFTIAENSSFNLDPDTAVHLNSFVKQFKGFYFRTNSAVTVKYYDKETLALVCSDGNPFWRHLEFEMKLHTYLARHTGFLFDLIAKYEKRVGMDSSEKDCYVFHESIDDNKWITLADLISQNGGLLRIPFLTRTRACIFIVKYWASQLLEFMSFVHKHGYSLVLLRPENILVSRDGLRLKLKSIQGCAKLNEFGKIQNAPDFVFNLPDHDFVPDPEADRDPRKTKKNFDTKVFEKDPYLAPEMIFTKIQELDQSIDAWAFGSLFYHILFGEPPKSFYQELIKVYPEAASLEGFHLPSDYFYRDLFPDDLINDILQSDHDIIGAKERDQTRMVDCIANRTFEALFKDIFPNENLVHDTYDKKNKDFLDKLGPYLDLIASCLEYLPSRRPTIKGLSLSPVFKLDSYETTIARQFCNVMIVYKSPSLTVRDRIYLPLRKICAKIIKKPSTIVNYENDILSIMDGVVWCLIEKKPKAVEEAKRTATTTRFPKTMVKYLGDEIKAEESRIEEMNRTGKTARPEESYYSAYGLNMTKEDVRARANNEPLVKMIFEKKVLDLLVFLALRHHTQARKLLKKNDPKVNIQYDDTVKVLKALIQIFKSIIFDMSGYDTSCAPYVQFFMENFIKFLLGEDFRLCSDVSDLLNENEEARIIHNIHKEYADLKVDVASSFLRNQNDKERDDADAAWKEAFTSRSYIFTQSHWTPDLYHIVGPVYKESVSESGIGSFNFPVIKDYIKFETDNNREFDFDMENRVRYMNHKANSYYRRTSDYFNDILHICENMQTLYNADGKNKSILRVSFQYLKALLQTNNTDKIKLILDSKILIQAVKFLCIEDVHIHAELLEILYEVSRGYEREILSMMSKDREEALKSVEESIKTIGVISQFQKSNTKDPGSRNHLIGMSYDYYMFNKSINNKYLRTLADIFESPVVMIYMTTVIKTQAELLANKKFVIKIFENISNGPLPVLKALNYSATDTISSICKLLVVSRKGIEIKQNTVLAPYLKNVFKKVLCDCRPEMIDYLNNIPGARALLREQGLDIPQKLSLTLLFDEYSALAEFYDKGRDKMIQEVQGGIISIQIHTPNHNTERLLHLEATINKLNTMILSWLKHYLKRREGEIVFSEIKSTFDKIVDLYVNIFDHFYDYGQINQLVTDILSQISYLFESLASSEFYYLFVSNKDIARTERLVVWMMEKINTIMDYYASLDLNEGKVDLKERSEKLMLSTLHGEEKKAMLLNTILDKQSIKRYGENRLMPCCHAFQRIFYHMLAAGQKAYTDLFEKVEFAKHFVNVLRHNFHIVSSAIRTSTETIHIITNYAEESRIRLKIFEKLIRISNENIKKELVATEIIHDICHSYMNCHDELDVSAKKLTTNFLPFRNFLPVRNESLAMMSLIVQYKDSCEFIHKDLILALVRFSNLRIEFENIRKYKKGLLVTTALYFFTIVLNIPDEQVYYIMRQEKIVEYLKDLLSKNLELRNYFQDLNRKLTNF